METHSDTSSGSDNSRSRSQRRSRSGSRDIMNIRNIIDISNGNDDQENRSLLESGHFFESSSDDEEGGQAQSPDDTMLSSRFLQDVAGLNQTPFANRIDLAADYQDSTVILSSDETLGGATNLIKTVATPPHANVKPNEEDEFRDGWLVKRHEDVGYATIKFGAPGIIRGIDVDLTGYTQCAPLMVSIHGCLRGAATNWTPLIDNAPLVANTHNFFEIRNNIEIHTHVHITVTPGGGVRRLRCYGNVVNPTTMGHMEFNLASTKLGAEIVQKPVDIVRGEFPNLIINRKESSQDGWISPRKRVESGAGSEYTIIKLAAEGVVDRLIVDTMHFIGNSPLSVTLEGCRIVEQREMEDPHFLREASWINLLEENEQVNRIVPNSFNVLPCIYHEPVTHVRFRPLPDGGVQQIVVKGSFHYARAIEPSPDLNPRPPKKRNRNDENEDVSNNGNRRKSTRTRRPVLRFQ